MVKHFVEDLSRKTGTPTLGRSGFTTEDGTVFWADSHGGDEGARAAAILHEEAHAYWDSIPQQRHQLRRDFNRLDEQGKLTHMQAKSVAYYAFSVR